MRPFQAPKNNTEKILTGEMYLDKKREEVRKELDLLKKRLDDIKDHTDKTEKAYLAKKQELDNQINSLSTKVTELEAKKTEALKPLTAEWDKLKQSQKEFEKQSNKLILDQQSVYNREIELEAIKDFQNKELEKIESSKKDLLDKHSKADLIESQLREKETLLVSKLEEYDIVKAELEKMRISLHEEMQIREAKLTALKEVIDQKELEIIKETKLLESRQTTLKQAFNLWRQQSGIKTEPQ